VILFRQEHVSMILDGTKTQTRRLGKKRWNVGSIHQAKTKLFGEAFARLRILMVRQEKLGDISTEDVVREGYTSHCRFIIAWELIHGRDWDVDAVVWVVDFELVKEEA